MPVHWTCGVCPKCVEGCSCMSTAAWKPIHAFTWDGLCYTACGEAQMTAVALVNSGASHCFVAEMLVTKFELPMLPADGMEVIWLTEVRLKHLRHIWYPQLCVHCVRRCCTVLLNAMYCHN